MEVTRVMRGININNVTVITDQLVICFPFFQQDLAEHLSKKCQVPLNIVTQSVLRTKTQHHNCRRTAISA